MSVKLWKGNEAIAEAAVRAGCKAFFGYPITPQSEVPEYLSKRLPQAGGVFVQAESEVSAINMVYGAAASGVRAMTSTSGPGFSLKQEGISYMCGAQLPAVIVDVMRAGPNLGTIGPSQSDYFQCDRIPEKGLTAGPGPARIWVPSAPPSPTIFRLPAAAAMVTTGPWCWHPAPFRRRWI